MKYLKDIKDWQELINEVVCGDCLEGMKLLPDKSISLALIDPPYGIGEASGSIGKKRSKNRYDLYEDTYENFKEIVLPVIDECLRICERVIVTPGAKNFIDYPRPDAFGVMYQPSAGGMNLWGFADAQPIFYYGRDPRIGITISKNSFVVTESARGIDHPCPKPIVFWKELLKKGSLEGDLVLDPFMGSWTTARACKDLGRNFIGFEISEKYCKIGEGRLRQEVLF